MIERRPGAAPSRSSAVVHAGVVQLVAVPRELAGSTYEQARDALRLLDAALAGIGADKEGILSVMVFLARMRDKEELNRAWDEWASRSAPPLRACVGAELTPGYLVELVVSAAVAQPAPAPPAVTAPA